MSRLNDRHTNTLHQRRSYRSESGRQTKDMARSTWPTIQVATSVSTTATHMDHGYYQVLSGKVAVDRGQLPKCPCRRVSLQRLCEYCTTPSNILLQSLWFVAILNGSTWPHADPAPFAKVFSAKLEIYQKCESFVPQKFPTIRYIILEFTCQHTGLYHTMKLDLFAQDMNYALYISENCSNDFDDNGCWIVVHIRSLGFLA